MLSRDTLYGGHVERFKVGSILLKLRLVTVGQLEYSFVTAGCS